LAGLWPRFASLCYEAILLVPVLFIAAYLFLALTHDGGSTLMRPLFQLWLLTVLCAYFLYCWLRGGRTLAMKTWHLRIAQPDGTRITPRQALARWVLALWGLSLLGAGFLWALVDRDRQFLHDRLAGTRIFTTRVAPDPGRPQGPERPMSADS
jgi:uncharacterized RDD family membrane protein YckC